MKRLLLIIGCTLFIFNQSYSQVTVISKTSPFPDKMLDVDKNIEVTFSEALEETSIVGKVKLYDFNDGEIPILVTYSNTIVSAPKITIDPVAELETGAMYHLVVQEGVRDENGLLVDLNADGSFGGTFEAMVPTETSEDFEEDLERIVETLAKDKLEAIDFYPDKHDPWPMISEHEENFNSEAEALVETLSQNGFESHLDYENQTFYNLIIEDEVILDGSKYYSAIIDDTESRIRVILNSDHSLVQDIGTLYRAHYFFLNKNITLDVEYLDEVSKIVKRIVYWDVVNGLLVTVRNAGVSYIVDPTKFKVVKTILEETLINFPELFLDAFIWKARFEITNEISYAKQYFEYNQPPLKTLEDVGYTYYVNRVISEKAHALLELIDTQWEENADLRGQLLDIALVAAPSVADEKYENIVKYGLGLASSADLMFNESQPLIDYMAAINQSRSSTKFLLINNQEGGDVILNSALVKLLYRSPVSQPNTNEVLASNLTPELSFSVFESKIPTTQKGFQIQVFNSGQMVYNTGLIQNTEDHAHNYNPGAYSGYDTESNDIRISEALEYGQDYEWKIRYIDSENNWSQWSDPGTFSVSSYSEMNGITLLSEIKSIYRDEQTITISWQSGIDNGQEYALELLQNGQVIAVIESNTIVKSAQYTIPSNFHVTQGTSGYQIRIREIGEDIEYTSSTFSIYQAMKDYDLSLNNLSASRTYVRPGNTVSVTYQILNSGNVTVSGDDYSVSYSWLAENGSLVMEGTAWGWGQPNLSAGVSTTNSSNISAPDVSEQFLTLKLTVEYDNDYKGGNNSASAILFIGDDNPYVTFERHGGGSFEVDWNTQTTVDGDFKLEVSHANDDQVRMRVISPSGAVEGYNLYDKDIVYIVHGGQFAFMYKYSYEMSGVGHIGFEYYLPLDDPNFFKMDQFSFQAEAGRVNPIGFTTTENSKDHRIGFFEDGTEDPDRFADWDFDETMVSGTEGTVDVEVPFTETRRNFKYWIKFYAGQSDRQVIQQLKTEVVDPIPDFFPEISTNTITLAPGRSASISISVTPEFDFSESIIGSIYNAPGGISYSFNMSEFQVGDDVQVSISLSENYAGTYGLIEGMMLGLYSDTRRKDISLYLNIVDDSNNFISISELNYIDENDLQDSLSVSFSASFNLATTSNTSNWEYHDGVDWIGIDASNIESPANYIEGDHSLIWSIPAGMQLPNARFRMKNKNGPEFLGQVQNFYESGRDFNGLAFDGSTLYVIDTDDCYYTNTSENRLYFRIRRYDAANNLAAGSSDRIDLEFNSGANSISEARLQLHIEGDYYFIFYESDDRLWVSRKDNNAGGADAEVSWNVQGRTMSPADPIDQFVNINGNLYTIHEDRDLDEFYLMDINRYGNLYSTSYRFPYGSNRDVDFAFWDGEYLYLCENNSIDKYTLDGQLQDSYIYSLPSGTDHIKYYDNKIYHTASSNEIYIHSMVDPYSFFSESQNFEINTTYAPEFIGESSLSLVEDQDFETIDIASVVADLDTDMSSLSFDFSQVSSGLELVFDEVNKNYSVKPEPDVDKDQSFKLHVSDGYNSITEEIVVYINGIDDNAEAVDPGAVISINEDELVKIPFDRLFADVDTEIEDLEISCRAFVKDQEDTPAGFTPELFIEHRYLQLQPAENQNGDFTISMEVVNNASENMLKFDFELEVIPVDDAPGDFALISPLNGRLIPGDVQFDWESSVDPDGDPVNYSFIISYDETSNESAVSSNSIVYNIGADLVGKGVSWQVIATDGNNERYPMNTRGSFTVVGDSSELYPFEYILSGDQQLVVPENESPGTVIANVLSFLPSDLDLLEFTLIPTETFSVDEDGYLYLEKALDFESISLYNLQLKVVYDGMDAISNQSNLNVTVENVNEAPGSLLTTEFSVDENSPQNTVIGSLSAVDPENDELIYSITAGNESGAIALNQSNELTISDPAIFDAETVSELSLDISVSDGEFSNVETVNISIIDINEVPALAQASFSINENPDGGALIGAISADDPDGDDLTYEITAGNDALAMEIDAGGQILVLDPAQFDYETRQEFVITVSATDSHLYTSHNYTISILDVNEAPGSLEVTSFSINENNPVSTVICTLSAVDPDSDELNYQVVSGNEDKVITCAANGKISIVDSAFFNAELILALNLAVSISDGEYSHSESISIQINNVNEAPGSLEVTEFSISETSPVNTIIGTLLASDPENDELEFTITAGNASGAFDLNMNAEIIVSDSAYFDAESLTEVVLEISISDLEFTVKENVQISISNVNEAPSILDASFALDENSANETYVGSLIVSDPEEDMLSFSIESGNEDGTFMILQETADIVVADSTLLDYETIQVFELSVRVSDGELSDNATIRISLVDLVDETFINGTLFSDIRVYPNPAKDWVIIDWEYFKKVSLYDPLGRLLLISEKHEINIQHLMSGSYLMRLESKNGELIHWHLIKE